MSKINNEIEKNLLLEKTRQTLESRAYGVMRCYLVALECVDEDPREIQESMQELGSLVRTLGDECVGATIQKRSRPSPATFIGQGKAEEIAQTCEKLSADYVAFDHDLPPSQIRNLESIINKPILDRTGIILQIFKKNARSREARTQVEIAQLEYLAPRLSNSWIAWERQRGGGGIGARMRGAGESQIELDRRRMRDRIAQLKKDLEKIQKEREVKNKKRQNEFNVVLVGYTNAGKTSLMNAFTESHLVAQDSLFQTLDPSVKKMRGVNNLDVYVTDTVGFIRNLPHSLVASFRSTLDEARQADLLLHVVDASFANFREHIKVTNEVLAQIGAQDVPQILIFNKMDLIKREPLLPRILARSFPKCLCISSSSEKDIDKLREAVVEYFAKNMVEKTFRVNYGDTQLLSLLYAKTRVLEVNWNNEQAIFKVRLGKAIYQRYFAEQDEEVI
ncbi:MAG: GTPase HflX [Silvanigrellaceae bacterium]|nr:GTPase HflX [Silvanigrellaceae bacterium]